ncbi:MAG: dihydropteroate synthase [Bacteroidia bacterium]|nr:MAG: dihydropteroate synthase [Bacteroidia bacterium]
MPNESQNFAWTPDKGYSSPTSSLNLGGRIVSCQRPLVMGILNVTDNSFYPGSRTPSPDAIRSRVEQIVAEGGDIVDVGACSTRPGSTPPTVDQELERLRMAISIVRELKPDLPISVDTYRASVADRLLEEFAVEMVNDVSAGEMDPEMFDVVAKWRVPYVLTHIQGTPLDMQTKPHYDDVVAELIDFFSERVERLTALGLCDLIVDPGFGFGKTIDHNYTLLKNLAAFRILGCPILAGLSRKSMLYRLLDISPDEALHATQTVDTIALLNGADILRVHDVLPAVQAVRIHEVYRRQANFR